MTLNGKLITEAELEKKREDLKSQKGAKLVEVSPGNYKIRLQG